MSPDDASDELDLLRGLDKDITVTTPIFLLGTNAKSAEQAAPETTATAPNWCASTRRWH